MRGKRTIVTPALLTGVIMLAGCSLAVGDDAVQCNEAADCEALGAAYADHQCVDSLCQPAVGKDWTCLSGDLPAATEEEITIGLLINTSTEGVLVTDATIRQCTNFDAECATPMREDFQADQDGVYWFQVPQNFTGFLDVAHPDYLPMLLFFSGHNQFQDGDIARVLMVNHAEIMMLGLAARTTIDPEAGLAVFIAADCAREPAIGVSISLKPTREDTVLAYFFQQLPNPELDATVAGGYAGAFNIEPGVVVVETTRKRDGTFIGRASFSVRAGTVSYVRLSPTPP